MVPVINFSMYYVHMFLINAKIFSYLFLKLYIFRKVIDHRNIWQDICPQVDN